MNKHFFGAIALSFLAVSAMPAAAQQAQGAGQAPARHRMQTLNQQPIDLQTAKNAVDSLLLLREKYKDHKFKGSAAGPAGVIEGMKNSDVREQILADLKKYGFDSIEDWVGKFMSVGMAVSYVQRNKDGKLEKRIEEIKARKDMPENIKARLLAMLTALIPPKGNAEMARQLLADPEYAVKVKKLIRRRKPASTK